MVSGRLGGDSGREYRINNHSGDKNHRNFKCFCVVGTESMMWAATGHESEEIRHGLDIKGPALMKRSLDLHLCRTESH